MIRDLFNIHRPVFITFDGDRFTVGMRTRDELVGVITDMHPVRKRFEGRRIVCRSMDGAVGNAGRQCALCRDRWSCTERVRLLLLLDGLAADPFPAVLEIGHASFDALDELLEEVGIDRIPEHRVAIALVRVDGRLRFTFRKAD